MKRAISIVLILVLIGAGIWIFTRGRDESAEVPVSAPVETAETAKTAPVEEQPLVRPVGRFESVGALCIYGGTGLVLLLLLIKQEKQVSRGAQRIREKIPAFMLNSKLLRKAKWRFRLKQAWKLAVVLAIGAGLLFLLPLEITPEQAALQNEQLAAQRAAKAEMQAAPQVPDAEPAESLPPVEAAAGPHPYSTYYFETRDGVHETSELRGQIWWAVGIGIVLLLLLLTRKSKGAKIFLAILLIPTILVPVININTQWRTVHDRVFEEANKAYLDQEYEKAAGCYDGILWFGEGGHAAYRLKHYKQEQILNNYALSLMQLGKNREALDIMKGLCCGDHYAGDEYLVNLLVAACGCGISSDEILAQVPDLESRLLKLCKDAKNHPGDYVKLRDSLAYNLAYMDLEEYTYQHGEGIKAAEKLYQSSVAAKESGLNRLQRIRDVLKQVDKSNQSTFKQDDPDVDELDTYIGYLMKGYTPQVSFD